MAIEVELPDGTIAEFPDGTDNATMERALASYRKPASTAPNFGNVRSGSSTTETPILSTRARIAKARSEGEAAAAKADYDRMSMGGNAFQQGLAGAGDALLSLYRGAKQNTVDNALKAAAVTGVGLRGAGLLQAGNFVDQRIGSPLLDSSLGMRDQEAQTREDNAAMAGSIPAQVGKIGTYAGTALAPGALARNTPAASVLLPQGIRGNAALGAVYGGLQPYVDDAEHAINTGIGAVAGGAIPGVVRAVRGTANFFGPQITTAERRAGQAITSALNGRQLNVQPSAVPGVQRTLGEASLDPGVMALERNVRRIQPDAFAQIDSANNAARVGALQRIAGTDADLAAAQSARNAASSPLYAAAKPKVATVDDELQASLGRLPRGVMNKARELARMEGASFPETPGQMTGAQLHYVKLALDDMIGRVGVGAMGRTEGNLAMGVKSDLIDNISRLIPEYGEAMQAHAAASGPINRMQLGRELIDSGSAGVREAGTGLPRLTPGTFARTADLDTMAQRATGFSKAKAADIFSPQDMQTHSAIQDDLERQFARQTNPAQPGSATMEATELTKRMLAKGLLGRFSQRVPVLGPLVEGYQTMTDQAMQQKLAQLVANPAEAQRVLAALPPAERSFLERALLAFNQGSGTVGVVNGRDNILGPLAK